jgi:hypothetical protein
MNFSIKHFTLEFHYFKQKYLESTPMLGRSDGKIGGNHRGDIFGKRQDSFLAQFLFHAQDLFSMNLLCRK